IHAKPLVLVNVEGYFDGFLAQIDRGLTDGFLKPEHRDMLEVVTSVDDVFDALARWQAPSIAKWLVEPPPKP
ncbi:MAG: LOG family protein, partial [Vicinamibacteria bacterium]